MKSFILFPDQACHLDVGGKELTPLVPEEAPASETDINLEVSFAEQAVSQKESSREKTQRSKGDDAMLLVCTTYSDVTIRLHFSSAVYFEKFKSLEKLKE